MVPPSFAANGCARDQHNDSTSRENADGNVQMFVGEMLLVELLFSVYTSTSFSGYMTEHGINGWWGRKEHRCNDDAWNGFHMFVFKS